MHLDVSAGMNLVHRVSRSSAGLAVKVVTHDEHAVIAQTSKPDVAFTAYVQHHSLANVQPAQHATPLSSIRYLTHAVDFTPTLGDEMENRNENTASHSREDKATVAEECVPNTTTSDCGLLFQRSTNCNPKPNLALTPVALNLTLLTLDLLTLTFRIVNLLNSGPSH